MSLNSVTKLGRIWQASFLYLQPVAKSSVPCLSRKCKNQLVVRLCWQTLTFHAVLLYIYTGKIEKNDATSYIELIYGAEKYDLSELKEHCFYQLYESVTDETIGILAVAAENYNADEKTKECIKEYCQR